MTRFAVLLLLLLSASCEVVLRGAVGGDCDPPRAPSPDLGSSQGLGGGDDWRRSNCTVAGTYCCRRSADARFTVCNYVEDCYRAPYMGRCATAVDCADEMSCMEGTCQCTLGGPSCQNPLTLVTSCCRPDEICMDGQCQLPATPGP